MAADPFAGIERRTVREPSPQGVVDPFAGIERPSRAIRGQTPTQDPFAGIERAVRPPVAPNAEETAFQRRQLGVTTKTKADFALDTKIAEARTELVGSEEGTIERQEAQTGLDKLKRLKLESSELGIARTEAETKVALLRKPFIALKGVEAGLTFGLSNVLFNKIEEATGGRITAQSTDEQIVGAVSGLLGTVLSGQALAGGIKTLTARFGVQGLNQLLIVRAGTAGILSGTRALTGILSGDIDRGEAAGNFTQSLAATLVGMAPELILPPGIGNFAGQIATDFLFDFTTDKFIRKRMEDQSFRDWFIKEELQQLALSIVFAGEDLKDKKTLRGQQAVVRDAFAKAKNKILKRAKTVTDEEIQATVQTLRGETPAAEPGVVTAKPLDISAIPRAKIKTVAGDLGLSTKGPSFLVRKRIVEFEAARQELQASTTPIGKLTALIKGAASTRAETEKLQAQARKVKAAKLAAALGGASGEEALRAGQRSLKGELPTAEFEAPRIGLNREEITGLFNQIRTTDVFGPRRAFTTLDTMVALNKLLAGKVPQPAEIAKLEKVFGPDLVKAIKGKRKFSERFFETFVDVLGVQRTLKTMLDASAVLRQGALLLGEPTAFGKALGNMAKVTFSAKNFDAFDDAIRAAPNAQKAEDSGLFLAPKDEASKLTEREEAFQSRLAERIPFIGPAVKASERAFNGFLNSLRADTFSKYADIWGDSVDAQGYKDLATFINRATGRGSLGKGALANSAALLNTTFFSPRFVASRFQAPLSLIKGNAKVRKVAAKNYVSFLGAMASALGLSALAGADVEDDPRSSDFGKARFGKTRVDFSAGFAPLYRYFAQFISGNQKDIESGKVSDVDRSKIIGRFIKSKLAPAPSTILALIDGKTFTGEDVDAKALVKEFMPIILESVWEAWEEQGPLAGFLVGAAEFSGLGASTFDKVPGRKRRTRRKARKAR